MGLILIPSEVMNCAEELRDFLAQNADSYSGTMQKVQNFSWNTELKTVTYDTLKKNLPMVHGIIVGTMIMAQESVNSDLSILESSVGNEELFEDELVLQIERLNAECRNYENTISNLQELCSNPFIEMFGFVCSFLSELIESNRALLEHTRAEITRLEEKLDFLYEVSNSTRGLFQTGIDLFGMADNAIHDSVVAITGVGEYSKGELDWKIHLPESINERNKEIEAETEQAIIDTLLEELGIEIAALEEMYEEKILEQLKAYVIESEIDLSVSTDKQAFVAGVMYNYTGYQLSKENGKYYYTDVNGIKKEATVEVVVSMLQTEANIQKLLNIAYDEVGTKETPENEVKYNNWYYRGEESLDGTGKTPPNGDGYPWCAVFVSWCANEAGMLDNCVPRESGCARMKKKYQENNSYYLANDGYAPKAGDVFVHLNANGTGHVGYVVAYDEENNKIYTIEGNSGNEVALNVREYDSYFDGFGSNGGNTYGTIPEQYQEPDGRDR